VSPACPASRATRKLGVTELDRKPYLLGVENGVVDLRTGELRESEAREDYVTKRCPMRYKPRAKALRWESLIMQVTVFPISADQSSPTRRRPPLH
jgi:putative DNA primase/helicase